MNHYIFTLFFIKSHFKITVSQTLSSSFLTSFPLHPMKYFLLTRFFVHLSIYTSDFWDSTFHSVFSSPCWTFYCKRKIVFNIFFNYSGGGQAFVPLLSVVIISITLLLFYTRFSKLLQLCFKIVPTYSGSQCFWLNKSSFLFL